MAAPVARPDAYPERRRPAGRRSASFGRFAGRGAALSSGWLTGTPSTRRGPRRWPAGAPPMPRMAAEGKGQAAPRDADRLRGWPMRRTPP